jgi:hypothetical protein
VINEIKDINVNKKITRHKHKPKVVKKKVHKIATIKAAKLKEPTFEENIRNALSDTPREECDETEETPQIVDYDPTLEEWQEKQDEIARKEAEKERERKRQIEYRKTLKEKSLEDDIRSDFRDYVAGQKERFHFEPIKFQVTTKQRPPVDVVLVISDTHVGKIVDPREVNYISEYNPMIWLQKLYHLETKVVEILTLDHPCKCLHLALLGDLVDGMLDHAEEIPGRTLIAPQLDIARRAFFQFIGRLSKVVPQMKIYGVPGNHGRFPNQKKNPSVAKWSNFDTILLDSLSTLVDFSDMDNVEMIYTRSPRIITEIAGKTICMSHGDELRGGDKAMGVPLHAILRYMNTMSAHLTAEGKKAPDIYIVGDKHKPVSLPTPTGAFLMNASWIKTDGYALQGGFTPTEPQQLMFGVYPHVGISWRYDLYVKDPTEIKPIPYKFPANVNEDLKKWKEITWTQGSSLI